MLFIPALQAVDFIGVSVLGALPQVELFQPFRLVSKSKSLRNLLLIEVYRSSTQEQRKISTKQKLNPILFAEKKQSLAEIAADGAEVRFRIGQACEKAEKRACSTRSDRGSAECNAAEISFRLFASRKPGP